MRSANDPPDPASHGLVNAAKIVRHIIHEFRTRVEVDLKSSPPEGDSGYTREILTGLCRVGSRLGFKVCSTPPAESERDDSEWLYDVTWLKASPNGVYLANVPLVGECEWGNVSAIDYDFQKLLVARATLRVMVYQDYKDKEIVNAPRLIDQIAAFHGAEKDRYLLIALTHSQGDWSFVFRDIETGRPGERDRVYGGGPETPHP